MGFNPRKARDENKFQGLPPNDYLMAVVSLELTESKTQRPMLKLKQQAFWPGKGSYTERMVLPRLDSNGTPHRDDAGVAGRFGRFLVDALGFEDEIDLTDERALKAAILRKPYKARLRRTTSNGYVNNETERVYARDQLTDSDLAKMDEWLASLPPADDDGATYDDAPPPSDDDIPF